MSECFRKTEGVLYSYMQQIKTIARLKKKLTYIEKNILELTKEHAQLSNLKNFTIPEQPFNVNLTGLYIKTLPASYQEKYIETYGRMVDKLYNKLVSLEQRRIKLKLRIVNKQDSIQDIKIIFSELEKDDKKFLELKYRFKLSNYQIASKIQSNESAVRRKRIELIDYISKELTQN